MPDQVAPAERPRPSDLPPDAPYWDELLVRTLGGDGVRAVFQPIVDLERLVTAGYEALARFDLAPAVTPDQWFAAAAVRNLVPELEAATLRAALRARPSLPRNTFLTVNIEPESLFADSVRRVFDEQGDLGGLVVEITEHRPLQDAVLVSKRLQELRSKGALIAVDDAGAGHSGLQQILMMRPSILKLDRSLVEDVDRDEAKAALIEMIGLFADRIDSWLLAEGIESEGEARRLMELGVPLAQGFLFAEPAGDWGGVEPRVRGRLLDHASRSAHQPLLPLVERVPAFALDDIEGARYAVLSGLHPFVVLIDELRRPVGALDAPHAIRGELIQPMRCNVNASPDEVANRISTRIPVDTCSPVLATDDEGKLAGQVTIARLLAHLGRAGR